MNQLTLNNYFSLSDLENTVTKISQHINHSVFDLLKGQKTALVACPPIALYNVINLEKEKGPREPLLQDRIL